MNAQNVITYLAIINAGLVCAPIADSFSRSEILRRLQIVKPQALITQGTTHRLGKSINIYEKLRHPDLPPMFVGGESKVSLRGSDQPFQTLK